MTTGATPLAGVGRSPFAGPAPSSARPAKRGALPAFGSNHLLHASARSPWESAVVCEQGGVRRVSSLNLPNGSVAACCPGELSDAMCQAALDVWSDTGRPRSCGQSTGNNGQTAISGSRGAWVGARSEPATALDQEAVAARYR